MYGSGHPLWGDDQLSSPHQQTPTGGSKPHRRQSPSYQNDPPGAYSPPTMSGTYAQQQTQITEDSLRTQYEAEATANTVLSQMAGQRHQLQQAHDAVYDVRENTDRAKRELADLATKSRKKRRRLQFLILVLGGVDFIMFSRIWYCGGSFFCRRYY